MTSGGLAGSNVERIDSVPPLWWQRTKPPTAVVGGGGGKASSHTVVARGQRGANEQPGGRPPGGGAVPVMPMSRWRKAIRGTEPRSSVVYGWDGARNRLVRGPTSTSRPAYITPTRSASSSTTARSCVT